MIRAFSKVMCRLDKDTDEYRALEEAVLKRRNAKRIDNKRRYHKDINATRLYYRNYYKDKSSANQSCKVVCEYCNTQVRKNYLKRHQNTQKCKRSRGNALPNEAAVACV